MGSTATDGKEGEPDFCVIELGGTVGDIESMPFIEVRATDQREPPSSLLLLYVPVGTSAVPVQSWP